MRMGEASPLHGSCQTRQAHVVCSPRPAHLPVIQAECPVFKESSEHDIMEFDIFGEADKQANPHAWAFGSSHLSRGIAIHLVDFVVTKNTDLLVELAVNSV